MKQILYFFAVLVGFSAFGQTEQHSRVLYAIGGISENSKEFATACAALKAEMPVEQRPCLDISSNSGRALLNLVRISQPIDYVLTLEKRPAQGDLLLRLQVLHPEDSTEPRDLKWNLSGEAESSEIAFAIQKIKNNYDRFVRHKDRLKLQLLVNGAETSHSIKAEKGHFIDRKTQSQLSFQQAYEKFRKENQGNQKFLAAGLEISAVILAGTINYYAAKDRANVNREDWDYPDFGPSMKNRFLTADAWRFDDNQFSTNRNHYYAGWLYYTLARGAGIDRLNSLLVTMASSGIWEFFSENREVVSLNDMVNTGYGGFIMGEAFYQMGKIFASGKNTGPNRILKAIFKSPEKASTYIQKHVDKREARLVSAVDTVPDVWSKLDLSMGAVQVNGGQPSVSAAAVGEVIGIPLFEEAGYASSLLLDTVASKVEIEKVLGPDLNSFKIFTKTVMAAYYLKNLSKSAQGELSGYNLYVGPSAALEISESSHQRSHEGSSSKTVEEDFHGIAHVLGGTVDVVAYHSGYRIRLTIDVYGDFTMIRSFALDPYSAVNDISKVPTVLRNRGYYYGVGATESLAMSIEKAGFELGISFQHSNADIINSRSRFYEKDTLRLKIQDQFENTKVWLAYQISRQFKIEVGVQKIWRSGSVIGQGSSAFLSGDDLLRYGKLIYIYK